MNNFGERLKELRIKNNLTQRELAKYIGSTNPQISLYERNITTPSIDILLKLSYALDTPIEQLLDLPSIEILYKNYLLDQKEHILICEDKIKCRAGVVIDERCINEVELRQVYYFLLLNISADSKMLSLIKNSILDKPVPTNNPYMEYRGNYENGFYGASLLMAIYKGLNAVSCFGNPSTLPSSIPNLLACLMPNGDILELKIGNLCNNFKVIARINPTLSKYIKAFFSIDENVRIKHINEYIKAHYEARSKIKKEEYTTDTAYEKRGINNLFSD